MCAKMKSANPLSGLIPWNWLLFCGLTCNRRQTEKENVKSSILSINR